MLYPWPLTIYPPPPPPFPNFSPENIIRVASVHWFAAEATRIEGDVLPRVMPSKYETFGSV